jgi:hypothetical protein
MALFNARLGSWLGNPGVHGADTYRTPSPRFAFMAILAEALGLTTDRRRYVSDAGCDPRCGFEDLGGAIRRIRIDLGVPIDMETMKIRPPETSPGAYCAVGRIRYSEVDGTNPEDDGWRSRRSPPAISGSANHSSRAIAGWGSGRSRRSSGPASRPISRIWSAAPNGTCRPFRRSAHQVKRFVKKSFTRWVNEGSLFAGAV